MTYEENIEFANRILRIITMLDNELCSELYTDTMQLCKFYRLEGTKAFSIAHNKHQFNECHPVYKYLTYTDKNDTITIHGIDEKDVKQKFHESIEYITPELHFQYSLILSPDILKWRVVYGYLRKHNSAQMYLDLDYLDTMLELEEKYSTVIDTIIGDIKCEKIQ